MIVRHRTPTIFSIYMVDVLCCALGCVILLWQLYHSESETALHNLSNAEISIKKAETERDELKNLLAEVTKEKTRVTIELSGVKDKLDRETRLALIRQSELEELRKTSRAVEAFLKEQIDKKSKLAIVLQRDLEDLQKNHRATEHLLASLKIDYADLRKKSTITSTELAEKLKAHAELLTRSATLEKRLSAMEKELNLKSVELKLAADKSDLSAKKVEDAEARAKKLEKLMAELKAAGKESLAKLSVSDLRIKLLEQQLLASQKELSSSGKRIEELLTQKDLLLLKMLAATKDLTALREAADRRFEGITLQGHKVVFLIDVSGSMVLKDRTTPDKEKWQKVVQTIERVAASLVDAEYYQVIVFSTKAEHLIGATRKWEKFDRAASPKRIGDALRALKPDGGTNMYSGLEKTFEMRPLGLETVFVFSDGLPTEGPGLDDADMKLSPTDQSEKLGRHIRHQLTTKWNAPISGNRVQVNAVGFFFESPDVGAFLWALARENEGSFVGMSRP